MAFPEANVEWLKVRAGRVSVVAALVLAGCGAAPKAERTAYSEADVLAGATMLEKLSRVSQLDQLEDTDDDAARCGCAAALNAFLASGGTWEELAERLGLAKEPTQESVHRLQERLYDEANVDGEPGIYGGCRPLYDAARNVVGWERKEGDEAHRVFEAVGLETWALFGRSEATLNDRREAVLAYFRERPLGALIVGVNEDMDSGRSLPVTPGTFANHYIVVLRRDGAFLRLDSWAEPGARTLHPMTDTEVRELVFETPITLLATALAQR